MSPHAIRDESSNDRFASELAKFAVTKNAFLPEHRPLSKLPDPYYDPWEQLGAHLADLIDNGIRDAVRNLPLLSTDRLQTEEEWRRAYVLLAFVAQAYIWGGEKAEEVLPPQITIPLLRASAHLELPPVLTYAGANLWNFSCQGNDFTRLEDLRTLFSFTNTESEDWFFLISVAMEARAAEIIHTMVAALEAIKIRDHATITNALDSLRDCIDGIAELLERMYERCDPMTFYHRIRPFLAGSKNMAAAGLPKGVFYDEGNGQGKWRRLRGGSNGQSSLLQCFDVFLGVEHTGHGNSATQAGEKPFLEEAKDYMPGPHRRFLVHMARMGSIRELALQDAATEEHRRLQAAYSAATEALSKFRDGHIRIVTRYIILPSKQPWSGRNQKGLASSSGRKGVEQLTGTGGTTLMPFLKQVRDETSGAGQLKG